MNNCKRLIKRLGIVTNPLQLDKQDTFFLFLNEAVSRDNLEVFVFDADDLSRDGFVEASLVNEVVTFETRSKLDPKRVIVKLEDFDLVFLKKDPPIDKCYERLLNALLAKKIPTVNHPKGLLKMGTKAYLKHFPELTPKTFYANRVSDALKAIKKLGNCVMKQSDSYGGKGVTHIRYKLDQFYGYKGEREILLSEDDVLDMIKEYLKHSRDKTILIVEYFLSAPKRGDKRVVVLEGEILGSYIRLPDLDNGICVCANNGAKLCDPTENDRKMVKILKPHFKKNGIELAALDLLVSKSGVEHLSEINILDPGFCNLGVVHPELNIAKKIVDMLCRKMG